MRLQIFVHNLIVPFSNLERARWAAHFHRQCRLQRGWVFPWPAARLVASFPFSLLVASLPVLIRARCSIWRTKPPTFFRASVLTCANFADQTGCREDAGRRFLGGIFVKNQNPRVHKVIIGKLWNNRVEYRVIWPQMQSKIWGTEPGI